MVLYHWYTPQSWLYSPNQDIGFSHSLRSNSIALFIVVHTSYTSQKINRHFLKQFKLTFKFTCNISRCTCIGTQSRTCAYVNRVRNVCDGTEPTHQPMKCVPMLFEWLLYVELLCVHRERDKIFIEARECTKFILFELKIN